jgi:hypothetical protein
MRPDPWTRRSAIGAALCAAFAATGAGAQIIVRPQIIVPAPAVVVQPQPVYVAPQPVYVAPQPVYAAPQPVYAPPPEPAVAYVPAPLDPFIVGVALADIVIIGGDTYIWALDANGHRYRRFYAHGDHRSEIWRRHDELHRVMARNGGHLPEHGEARPGQVRGGAEARHEAAAPHAEHHAAPAPRAGGEGREEHH